MSDTPDEPSTLAAVAPPEQIAAPPPSLEPPHPGAALRSVVGLKLATVMFLSHFSLGAWIVTLGAYIEANTGNDGARLFAAGFIGKVYGAGPLGGMIAPFLTGLLADHFFATERIMAVLHLLAASALYWAMGAESQSSFYLAMIAYFVCFIPAFALTASMTMHHLARPERDFPVVRACSTSGWVAAGLVVGWLWPLVMGERIEASTLPMQVGMVGELTTALFCLFLPHTPPANRRAARAPKRFSGSQTLDLVKQPLFLVVIGLAALAHIPSQFYYAYGNVYFNEWLHWSDVAAKMTLGQVVEVICMLLLPAVLLRMQVKTAIAIGLSTWAARFFLMSAAAAPFPGREALVLFSIAMHGMAFTMVTISLQLEVDRCAGRMRRATAQGLLAVAMSGVGCFLGAELAGRTEKMWLPEDLSQATAEGWRSFWLVPGGLATLAVVLVLMLLPRHGPGPAPAPSGGGTGAAA
jgi:nucleoside transporter